MEEVVLEQGGFWTEDVERICALDKYEGEDWYTLLMRLLPKAVKNAKDITYIARIGGEEVATYNGTAFSIKQVNGMLVFTFYGKVEMSEKWKITRIIEESLFNDEYFEDKEFIAANVGTHSDHYNIYKMDFWRRAR